MDFDVSFTSKKLTPWGGMIFLKEMLQKLGFRAQIEENQDLPQSGSNRGYKTLTIVEGFITRVWCGANQFLHTEVTRHDAALDRILDWKNTPGQDTYKRFFGKFNQATNQKVSDYLYQRVFNNFNFDNFPTDEVLEFLNYLLRKSPPQVLRLIPRMYANCMQMLQIKKGSTFVKPFVGLVGVAGFEPTTFCSQSPKAVVFYFYQNVQNVH